MPKPQTNFLTHQIRPNPDLYGIISNCCAIYCNCYYFAPNKELSHRVTAYLSAFLAGPFWVCVTLIFTVAMAGNFASYIQFRDTSYEWRYDFHKGLYVSCTVCVSWICLYHRSRLGYCAYVYSDVISGGHLCVLVAGACRTVGVILETGQYSWHFIPRDDLYLRLLTLHLYSRFGM